MYSWRTDLQSLTFYGMQGRPLQGSAPAEGAPALSSWLKQQEALMAAKGDTSTLSTWLSQQRALMAAAQHLSTESDVSAHSGPDCSASEGTGVGTVAIAHEQASRRGDAVLAATADSSDKLKGATSPYVMLMASMKAAMADAEFQKVLHYITSVLGHPADVCACWKGGSVYFADCMILSSSR